MRHIKRDIERSHELPEQGQRRLVQFVRGPVSRFQGTVLFGGAGVRTVGGTGHPRTIEIYSGTAP